MDTILVSLAALVIAVILSGYGAFLWFAHTDSKADAMHQPYGDVPYSGTRMTLTTPAVRPEMKRLLAWAEDGPPDEAVLERLLAWAKDNPPDEAMLRAQRRSWAIGELMLDDPSLTREDAEARIDATLRAYPRMRA